MAWLCLTASTRADPALHGVRQSLGRLLCLSGSRTDKSSTISVTSTGLQGFAVPEKQRCLKKKKKIKKSNKQTKQKCHHQQKENHKGSLENIWRIFCNLFLSFKPLGCLSHHSFWHLCNKGALEAAWLEVKAEIHMTLRAGVLQKQENQTSPPHQLTSWHFDILHQQHRTAPALPKCCSPSASPFSPALLCGMLLR